MKTVECFKHKFEVPDWANYVAVDPDGSIWVFAEKPEQKYKGDSNNPDSDWYPKNTPSFTEFDRVTSVEVHANAGDLPLYVIPTRQEFINVMIDLETLGRSAGCSVMSIGAVVFSDKLGREFYASIDRDSCDQAGLFEDQDTLDWWNRQSDEAMSVFNEPKVSLHLALTMFSDWLSMLGPRENIRIWGMGAAFDNAIMIALYRIMGIELPWNYNGDMCFRTLKALVPNVPYERIGTYHNALDDAKTQAVHAIAMLERLNAA